MPNPDAFIVGGFADPVPPPLASRRHLWRFLLIAAGIAVAMLLQTRGGSSARVVSRVPLYFGLIAVELVFVWFVSIGVHARGYKLVDIAGRRWHAASHALIDLALGLSTALLLRFVVSPLLVHLLGRWFSNTSFLLPSTASESALWILVSMCAGVCEELVYRGYLQRQLWNLTSSLALALTFQSMIFALGHIYQGWRPALVTAVYGLIFGLVAAWRRSVIPGALAHSIVDVAGGLKFF